VLNRMRCNANMHDHEVARARLEAMRGSEDG